MWRCPLTLTHTHTCPQFGWLQPEYALCSVSYLHAKQNRQPAWRVTEVCLVCVFVSLCKFHILNSKHTHTHIHTHMTSSNRLHSKYHVTVSWSRMMKHPLLSRLSLSHLLHPPSSSWTQWKEMKSFHFHPQDHPPH